MTHIQLRIDDCCIYSSRYDHLCQSELVGSTTPYEVRGAEEEEEGVRLEDIHKKEEENGEEMKNT